MNIYSITNINAIIIHAIIIGQVSFKSNFFHVINCKFFRNISQTQWIWSSIRAFRLELVDVYELNVQKTVAFIVMQTQTNFVS